MEPLALLRPSKATLKKYGLDDQGWDDIAQRQGYACGVCKQLTKTGRLCIDHEHVKNWKKMPPEQRVLFVRGLLCWRCNTTFVGRGITVERSQNVTSYLVNYQQRQSPQES